MALTQFEYLHLDERSTRKAKELFELITSGLSYDHNAELLLHFCYQAVSLLPKNKRLAEMFIDDLIEAIQLIHVQFKNLDSEVFNFIGSLEKSLDDIQTAKRVVKQFLGDGFRPAGPISKLISHMDITFQRHKISLQRAKRKGPSSDVHETEGIWLLVTLFETFLKSSPSFKIRVFNRHGLETESEKKKLLHSVTAQRLTMNLLAALSVSRTEQVIRKRVKAFIKEMKAPDCPLLPSDQFPKAVIYVRKKNKTWKNRWDDL